MRESGVLAGGHDTAPPLKLNLKHELRTPLNHIIGYSEMLLEECREGAIEGSLQPLTRIHGSGIRLLALVEAYFAPPRPGASDPGPGPRLSPELELRVQEILAECAHLGSLDGGAARKASSTDLGRIAAAARRLEELASNLESIPAPRTEAPSSEETRHFAKSSPGSPGGSEVMGEGSSRATGVLLVVDDDDGNREMLQRRLVRLGHQVIMATNGIEALNQLRNRPIDLVLLDLQMPEMDGFEALVRIRSDPGLQDLPVIILSASSDIHRVARCIQMGAEDYLPKPFNPILLQTRIGTCLEKKRLRDREAAHLLQLREEQRRSDELLHAILPREVASELKATDRVRPTCIDGVAVLFTDIVGFTGWSGRQPADTVHRELQSLIEAFEDLATRHGLEKIKTIGDSFMATAGLLHPTPDAALAATRCALEMISVARRAGPGWAIRAGIHVGTVSAGVVGRLKYQYDVWGDTVNTAARMEQAAPAGSICVEASTWRTVEAACVGTCLGSIAVKGKGDLNLYAIHGLRVPELSLPQQT